MAAQDNAIRTNYVESKIDKTQQNCKCWLCDERDETITHRKVAQKDYKTRHDWVGKMTHWKLYKKLKFDRTNKWYRHKHESVFENEVHTKFSGISRYKWITKSYIDDRSSDSLKKKENLPNSELCHPGWPQCENERKWKKETHTQILPEN